MLVGSPPADADARLDARWRTVLELAEWLDLAGRLDAAEIAAVIGG